MSRIDLRVLIVDDTRLYREGLAHILGQCGGFSVVGVASDAGQSVERVGALHPDIVLLRVAAPGALEILRGMMDVSPEIRVVALEVEETEGDVIGWAEAGVAGYLPRTGSLDDLIVLLQSVARGEALCSPRMAATLLKRVAALAAERQSQRLRGHLTLREREIIELIDQGFSNKEIAHRLSIEVRTVKNHVHNILEKLQVHRRGEAAALMREMAHAPRRFAAAPSRTAAAPGY